MKNPLYNDVFSLAENREYKKLIQAVSKKIPKRANLIDELETYNLDATKQDVSDWQDSRLLALDYLIPDWTDLIRVYDDVIVDSFLTGIIETIKDKVKATDFKICDKSGKEIEDKTNLLKEEWFFKFLDWTTEANYYPYSVIQLGDLIDDKFKKIKMIDREYFIPQKNFVKRSYSFTGSYVHDIDGWDITMPELEKYYIAVRSPNKLGLLDRVAYHVLGKKHMLIYMWRFGEMFGLPIRVGKTDISDIERRKNMEAMAANMGNNLWAVIDPEDEFNLIEPKSTGSNSNFFKEAMNFSNSEMSIALAGTESLFKEKSFVGSAEVGERIFEYRQKSILRSIQFIINNQLIPRMVFYGLPVDGLKFQFIQEDTVPYDLKITAVNTLGQLFEMDPEEVGKKTGYTLKPKSTPNTQNNNFDDLKNKKPTSVMKEVKALYADIMAPIPKIRKDERKKDFISRCMADPVMISEYPDEKQRYAICETQIK